MLDPQASQFWQAAIRSGLVDVEHLTACWDAIDPAKRDDPEQINQRLARRAVRLGSLTLWQAQQLLAGRATGYMVDRYRLLDLLGQGGMGRVYLARDTRLDRLVALKILAPERLNNPRALARFEREARMGARLQHENLVRIYDFGESNGRHFLVMERIEGKSIGALIDERGPVPPATAARLVRQVALGLEHAHRRGLIHRDVNPYNILVTHDGTAKLADMGLAIALAETDRVTRDGATLGTFDYVAPEQARDSRAADTRSDIYSLGCTMYHMCTGRVPFPAPTLPEKLLGHQAIDPPPLSRIMPGLPEGLSEIVRRMMKKSPNDRYATPIEVAQALAPYQDDHSGASGRESATLILPAQVVALAQPPGGVAHRHDSGRPTAPVRPAAAGLATNPDPRSYAADPAVPILTPDDEAGSADEIRLILDSDPYPSDGRTQTSTDERPPANLAARMAGHPTSTRLPGLVVLTLTVMATVLILILILAMVKWSG
jgi:eukaryotic-like serine/threonine-protein kinase